MENINLDNLNDETLIELISILQGMDDELKNKLEGINNEEN